MLGPKGLTIWGKVRDGGVFLLYAAHIFRDKIIRIATAFPAWETPVPFIWLGEKQVLKSSTF